MLATNIVSTALRRTPADTGYLRASRYVRRPVVVGTRFEVEIGFGAPYAIFVHEIDKPYVVGEWKFLANAVTDHSANALSDLASWTAKLAAAGKTIDDVPETHPRIWTGGARLSPAHFRKALQHMSKRERQAAWKARRKANARRAKQRAGDRAKNQASRVQGPLTPAEAAARDGRGP
jgi:hypothetical protein